MRNIEIMFNDGMIGNKSVLLALSSLTTGNLNSKLKQGANPYKMTDVLPTVHDYIVPPLTDEEKQEQVRVNLLSYMQLNPSAPAIIRDGK